MFRHPLRKVAPPPRSTATVAGIDLDGNREAVEIGGQAFEYVAQVSGDCLSFWLYVPGEAEASIALRGTVFLLDTPEENRTFLVEYLRRGLVDAYRKAGRR